MRASSAVTRLLIVATAAFAIADGGEQASAQPAAAPSGTNVLVIVNEASADSVAVGTYYGRVRGIPGEQVLRIRTSVQDEIDRRRYELEVEAPIAAWLNRHAAHDRILFVVLTKGIPLRIAGTGGRTGTIASVDSELALLYRKMTGASVPPQGTVANPYYLGSAAVADARPFTHVDHDIFLVTRLDGFTVEDVKGLIDRATRARNEGRILLDLRPALQERANEWMREADRRLRQMGLAERVLLDDTSRAVTGLSDVLGYYSWGSNDEAIGRQTGLTFVPGAIGGRFVSTDARTFTAPPESWKTGPWEAQGNYYAGSPQSLAGDLIREGITGMAAYVAEPFLDGSVRPDILFPAYLSGFTLAEAFYLASPSLSWQTVILGDPLCRIVRGPEPTTADLDPPIDRDTTMPSAYARRWVAAASRATGEGQRLRLDGVRASLRAQALLAREDIVGARAALEEASRAEPRLIGAQLLLASLYEKAGEYPQAMERYRSVLRQKRDDVVAMNNLAYHLAVREQKPGEALELAERARLLAPASPSVLDTVAWVYHLLGEHERAGRYMEDALRGSRSPDILVHAAAIYEAVGRAQDARHALDEAVKQRPELEHSTDVQELRRKLAGER